jgi:hypothetical protein
MANLQPLPKAPERVEDVVAFCQDLVRSLQQFLQQVPNVSSTLNQATAYTLTNVTEDRGYDANATSINELADALGTLISDLRDRGIVG